MCPGSVSEVNSPFSVPELEPFLENAQLRTAPGVERRKGKGYTLTFREGPVNPEPAA
jgi:hypothetical protein